MIYTLNDILESTVAQHPDRVAVRCGPNALTYSELYQLTNRMAAALLDRGLQPGDRVGIYAAKCVESVASMFAVLKAGGIYVPIDPFAPVPRVLLILNNCSVRHVIISERNLEQLRQESGEDFAATFFMIDGDTVLPGRDDWVVIERAVIDSTAELERGVERIESDLAYILYTSGSTGIPKGVMISHRAALTFIDWACDEFQVTSEDVLANIAPLHFDLSVFDVFAAVRTGAQVVLVRPEQSTFPSMLTKLIIDAQITIWYSVPSALTMMLTKGGFAKNSYPDLRIILFAGEVFPIRYFHELRRHTDARLCNLYGPTETNVCTFFDATDVDANRDVPLPIGKAIKNYDVVILSPDGCEVSAGEEGELCGRGPGLMSGYWGDAEKTSKSLCQNPLQQDFEEKIYHTGDIVKLDQNGDILYISRLDNMVKSRGYRIELGEIEKALYAHDAVREAAVIAEPDDEVTNRLFAYVATDESKAASADEILGHCRAHIPKYMVPEKLLVMAELPKTSTGKIDKGQLGAIK